MKYCCRNCFVNPHLQKYVEDNYEQTADCDYCGLKNVEVISTRDIGIYMRDCIEKAYEDVGDGTGAYYDDEEKEYYGGNGETASTYSIREILSENEIILNDNLLNTSLLEDLFENIYSDREIQKGAVDPYDNIDDCHLVIKEDLYGGENTIVHHAWEYFKHIIKHYNRFFEVDGIGVRKEYLDKLEPYLYDFISGISVGTIFYRTRKQDDSLKSFENIDAYKEMSPPPTKYAKTNRMSPAGISYLYLSSEVETTFAECRIKNENVVVAKYVSKEELQIVDLSNAQQFGARSIFDEAYNHDDRWLNEFWCNFVKEISIPVLDTREDHSYEYAATQVVAEYFRSKNFDGICFNSSVGTGKNYVFFFGPDPEYAPDAYPYPFGDPYLGCSLPILRPFTECFEILSIDAIKVSVEGKKSKIINTKLV